MIKSILKTRMRVSILVIAIMVFVIASALRSDSDAQPESFDMGGIISEVKWQVPTEEISAVSNTVDDWENEITALAKETYLEEVLAMKKAFGANATTIEDRIDFMVSYNGTQALIKGYIDDYSSQSKEENDQRKRIIVVRLDEHLGEQDIEVLDYLRWSDALLRTEYPDVDTYREKTDGAREEFLSKFPEYEPLFEPTPSDEPPRSIRRIR